MQATRRAWIGGAVAVALLIAIGAWFLIISPVRDESASTKADAETVEAQNDVLSTKVDALRKQFAKIDELRDELKIYQTQIPTTVDYESIIHEIDRSVEASGVALLSVNTESIVPVAPFTVLKPIAPPAPADPDNPDAAADEATPTPADNEPVTVSGAPPTATGALSETIPGFYQVPLNVKVQGSYEDVLKFSDSLEIDSSRSVLMTSVNVTALREAPASGAAPKTEVGDLSYEVSLLAYVLLDDSPKAADAEDPTTVELPAIGTKNVFKPER